MRRSIALMALAFALSAPARSATPATRPDPIGNLARIELRLATDARFASVRVLGNSLAVAEGRRLEGPGDLRTAVLENLLALSGNVEGQAAVGAYRVVLNNVASGTTILLSLNVQAPRRATVEVWNVNDEQRPFVVDRFEGGAGSVFAVSATQVLVNGPLPVPGRAAGRLVLAHYYPWYDRATWADPQLLDQPLRAYSTDDPADVLREMQDAQRAGLDGVIVSWQGPDTEGGWNDRRLRLVLDAAQKTGLRVSVLLETLAINGGNPDQDTLVRWLNTLYDTYASQPAFLRVGNRPVVFLYAWPVVSDATWAATLERVRSGGRNLLVVADATDPSALAVADGEFTYASNLFATDIGLFDSRLATAARTYPLLGAGKGSARVSVATASPGYDESGLVDRPLDRVVDRRGGALYEEQWRAALASGADWIVITSWNEWWENTQIEASRLYGGSYTQATRRFAVAFKYGRCRPGEAPCGR